MQRAFGLDIPQTLEDICDPTRLALVVYDMQVGIVKQIENGQQITDRVVQVLEAARKARVRVFFTRHMSLPKELMGVSQFRMAMAWQRVNSANEVNPWFLRDAPGFHLISEMKPLPSEAIFDKITMSAFEGTPLNIALRDCGIDAFAIVGIATEIAIEPTVRHPLILVTSLWWLKTPAVSVIAMRQSVHLRASNSQAMLCLQTSKRSAPSFGAYNRNRRWSGRDRRGASRRARLQMYVRYLPECHTKAPRPDFCRSSGACSDVSQCSLLSSESDANRFPRAGAASTTGPTANTGQELPHCACFP